MEHTMYKFTGLKRVMFALAIVAAVGACDAVSGRETAGEYVDDTTITSRVMAAIVGDDTLKKSQINVETFKNVVQLSGFVDSSTSVARAGEVARGVKGVTSVKNDLLVR